MDTDPAGQQQPQQEKQQEHRFASLLALYTKRDVSASGVFPPSTADGTRLLDVIVYPFFVKKRTSFNIILTILHVSVNYFSGFDPPGTPENIHKSLNQISAF